MRRPCVAVFLSLIFSAYGFAQNRGTVQCDPDMKQVPAWTSPGGAYVVEQLPCGEEVGILALEKGYFRVQFGNRTGYVYAKYVSVPEGQEQAIAQPEGQTGQEPQGQKPAERGRRTRHRGSLAFEVSHIYYDEPDFMRNKGFMYGFSGDYTYHPGNLMFKMDGRFTLGNVDYWSDGTGTAEGLRDYNFETRFSFGYDLTTASKSAVFIPFLGIGYRYLFDGEGGTTTTSGHIDYDRESNYLYSPLGIETMFRLGSGWSLGLTGEYDLFWHGWQYSHFEDIDPILIQTENNQKGGWGARGSVRVVKNFGKRDFVFEPFFRYWDIDSSNWSVIGTEEYPIDTGREPANTTTEWGAKVGILF